MLAGVKRTFKGEIKGEELHQVAEPARLLGRAVQGARRRSRTAIFVFYPGAPACSSSSSMRRPACKAQMPLYRCSRSTR